MNGWLWPLLASFFGAVLSALGMGGGGILLLYLTAFLGVEQLEAQGINLLFFIPIAAVALVLHTRKKLVEWRVVLPVVACGVVGVVAGAQLAEWLGSPMLTKLFAVFLLFIGVRELFCKEKPAQQDDSG